jgi:hypothetical protein
VSEQFSTSHKEDLFDSLRSPVTSRMVQSRALPWACYVCRTGETANVYTVRDPLSEMLVCERVSDFGIPIPYTFIMHRRS